MGRLVVVCRAERGARMQNWAQGAKVLVIDDNEENRALAFATLDDEGYVALLAKSGEEGIAAFQAEAPDCVLLDVRMPGMDGFAVSAALRALPRGRETPIIFLTALRDVDVFDRALAAGADDFLTKPVRPVELTARVQSALKLRRMSDGLREQVELVRQQRDALMRLQLQTERLTAFVVHDLKNPVGTMDLHAQLLLRDRSLAPRTRESVQKIRDEARGLLRLVLNLLDISRSQDGQLRAKREPIELAAFAAELLDAHELKAREAEITLRHVISAPNVNADADLLRRVIENLVENAIRHAPVGSEVVVSMQAVADGSVEIRVIDHGVGIAPEMREKVFDRFVQLEHGERVVDRASRGLGLTFCRLAVEAHGGTITIDNTDRGTAFCVRLPAC